MDLDRIKRNVAKMAEQGAPEQDIDGYIASEGATVDQVRAHKGGGWLRGLAQGAVDMVRGKQDPAYAGTPTVYDQFTDDLRSPTATAAMLGASDAGMADIIEKQLGDRFIRREKDAHGYDVLVTRGPDGQEQRGYVNEPGLDTQDLWRTFYGAVPYLVAGGGMGALTRNVGRSALGNIGLRTAAQGATAAAVSAGGDVGAWGLGSDQGVDLGKAAIAGGFGAGAEAASPFFHIGRNALGFGTKYIDDAGNLTKEGVEAAQRAGVDPKALDAETAAAFADALRIGRDPAEALSQVRSNRFGIPTTKGQRTKDPELLTIEKDIRYGSLGQDAKEKLAALDRDQAQAITNQVRGHIAPGRDGIDEYKGIGAQIAPTRMPHEQNWQTMGQSIRSGLDDARETLKGQERAAWEAMPEATAKPEAFNDLAEALNGRLGALPVDAQLTPVAMRMDAELAAFRDGKGIVADGPKLIQQTPVRTLDQMRRRLLEIYKSAAPGTTDAKAAKAIYDGFDDWVWDAAEKGLINGDPAAAAKMHAAREITREVKGLLQPRNVQGGATPANRILSQVMDEADTPEGVIAALLGSAGPHTPPKTGVVDALSRIKAILDKAGTSAGNMAGKETWNDIRLAYWLRLTTGKEGATLSPTMLKKNIDQAFVSQGSVLKTLFTEAERKEFRAFARAVGEAAYKDPNPSGTASALRAMANGPRNSLLKTALQTQSKRELFSKHNVIMSRIYSMLAQKVPNLGGSRDAIGLRAAQRAVDQRLSPVRPPSLGPFGAAYGGHQSE